MGSSHTAAKGEERTRQYYGVGDMVKKGCSLCGGSGIVDGGTVDGFGGVVPVICDRCGYDNAEEFHTSAAYWKKEAERARELVTRAVQGLKWIGPFHREPGNDPHPMDCSLAGRVSKVFCTGMTRAIALCHTCKEDPYWMEPRCQSDAQE